MDSLMHTLCNNIAPSSIARGSCFPRSYTYIQANKYVQDRIAEGPVQLESRATHPHHSHPTRARSPLISFTAKHRPTTTITARFFTTPTTAHACARALQERDWNADESAIPAFAFASNGHWAPPATSFDGPWVPPDGMFASDGSWAPPLRDNASWSEELTTADWFYGKGESCQ
jgi:hypothetical protein